MEGRNARNLVPTMLSGIRSSATINISTAAIAINCERVVGD